MANESLLITCLPDGTFHVKETEDAGETEPGQAPLDQSVQSPDDVLKLVQQFLSDESQEDQAEGPEQPDDGSAPNAAPPNPAAMKAAWQQEAATRDASGYRK